MRYARKALIGVAGATAALIAALAGSAAGGAKELIYTNFLPPQNVTIRTNIVPVLERVEKETGIKFKIHSAGSLLGIRATLGGLRDGIADIGFTLPFFHPGELPTVNALHDMIFVGDNTAEVESASLETFFFECPNCAKEFAKQNTLYLGGQSPPAYVLMCKDKVTDLDEVKGKKIRTTGSYARWVRRIGATPVNMSMAETAEAMQRGQIDCVLASMSFLKSFGLIDVVKYVIDYPMGIARATGLYTFNLKSWNGLTAKQKQAFLRAIPMGIAQQTMIHYPAETRASEALAKKRGVTIVKGSAKMAALMKRHVAADIEKIPAIWAKRGAKEPKRVVEAYLAKLEKWRGILAKTGNDPKKYEEALWTEIYSKLKY